MRSKTAVYAILAAVLAMACDNEPIDPVTGGPGSGAEGFTVVVTDDPAPGEATLDGMLRGALRVALRTNAGGWVDVGVDQDVEVPLHVAGDSIVLSGLTRPTSGDYSGVRLTFEGVDVDVLSGSVVGDSTLTQDFVLDVGSAGVATVEVLTPSFTVQPSTVIDIVVDLNSEDWVTGTNLSDLQVSQTDLANAVSVDVD